MTARFMIDRLEGDFALCEDETGNMRKISRFVLPADIAEGDVLRQEKGGFCVDKTATQARRERIKQKQNQLFK